MNKNLQITTEFLKSINACQDGIDQVAKYENKEPVAVIRRLVADNHWDWANWLIVRIMDYKQCVSYAVFAALQVIDIYEKKYPNDKRPRLAIEAAQRCIDDPSKKNKLEAAWAEEAAAAAAAIAYAAAAEVEEAAWAERAARAAEAARLAIEAAQRCIDDPSKKNKLEAAWAERAARAAEAEAAEAARLAIEAAQRCIDDPSKKNKLEAAWAERAARAAEAAAEIKAKIIEYGISLVSGN